MHATAVWMLHEIQGASVCLGPLPSLVNELNGNKEGPLIEGTPRIASDINALCNFELQSSFKRAHRLSWKDGGAVSAVVGTERALLCTGELVTKLRDKAFVERLHCFFFPLNGGVVDMIRHWRQLATIFVQ